MVPKYEKFLTFFENKNPLMKEETFMLPKVTSPAKDQTQEASNADNTAEDNDVIATENVICGSNKDKH